MAWLYVPDMPDSNWESTLHSGTDIELFVTSSGKPTPRRVSWRGWKTRPWIGRLCGTISNPSTAARGVDSWISSLAGTHANRSALPGSSLGPMIQDTFGLTFSALCEKSALDGFSSRTLQLTLALDSTPCYPTFTALATALRQGSLARRKSARPTSGSGCSSSENWPTVRSHEAGDYQRDGGKAGMERDTLTGAVKNWPTPNTPNGGRAMRPEDIQAKGATAGGKRQVMLENVAKLFPTPHARDADKWNNRAPGHERQVQLSGFCHAFHPAPETPGPGATSSNGRRRLNPLFVEWLMGWPLGWTDCGAVVTGSYRAWRATHWSALRAILLQDGGL